MIAAIANFIDVYDLELTIVENNIKLQKLYIEMTSKSIIVVTSSIRDCESRIMATTAYS